MNQGNKLETRVIHGGQTEDPTTGAVMPPIVTASTYKQSSPGKHKGFEYSRSHNPTRFAYERAVANLESGTAGFAFASGLAAISTILELLQPGDHVIAADDLYGGTFRLFDMVRKRSQGLNFSFVDCVNTANIEQAITPQTKMIWIETPSNPLLKLLDIQSIAKIAKKHNITTVCDNTFASPIIQRPLELGFDIVVHSATKYLNGHSDVISGVVVTKDDNLTEQMRYLQNAIGAVGGAFDSYFVLRGIKTLAIRMQRHCENAMQIAEWLEQHSSVKKVYYPGLESHPQHRIAKQQMSLFGGMISFELNASHAQTIRCLENLKLFTLAESLGGVESLVVHPASMTHAAIPADIRQKIGISDDLIRLSVGIEHVSDLINDLNQAITSV
jgi:O-succinylhomoserine (thiol)-lyase